MITLEEADGGGILARAVSTAEQAKGIQIRSTEDYTRAANYLTGVKGQRKAIAEFFAPLKKAANEAHKKLTTAEADADRPLKMAEDVVKVLLVDWQLAQERVRLAEEKRLQEEADRHAAEAKLDEAIAAEEAGDKEAAEEIIAAPVLAPVVQLKPATPKGLGISFSESWGAVVENQMALVKAVAAGQVPMVALTPNMVFLNGQARALKGELRIPGVRVTSSRGVSASAR